LAEIGRDIVEQRVERPAYESALRWALKEGLTSALFAPAFKLGQALRPLLPSALQNKVPPRPGAGAHRWPTREHPRKVLLLLGCVQPAMLPNINSATARVLDAAGLQTLVAHDAGCCGAIRSHLGDRAGGLADMRRNVDAWWPQVASGAIEAIVMNASGCGVTVKEYGHALAADPEYAERASRIAELTRDLSELLPDIGPRLKPLLHPPERRLLTRLTLHPPCSLQHGQQLRGTIEATLDDLGFEVQLAPAESHLCCGSAGTYSILQPKLSTELRDRKLAQLGMLDAQAIVSANIGCIQHLQSGTTTPVKHWIEVLDEALAGGQR
jgi:glycolate oxidase iron-sulfur subunit